MDLYELIGFIIGDGNIFYSKKHRQYRLQLAGNAEEDYDYFQQIAEFLRPLSKNKVQLFIRKEKKGKCLRLMLQDKAFVEKLISIGIPAGKKTFTIEFPRNLTKDMENSLLRGLFEADGCLYFSKSKKNNYTTYPRIEICTSSKKLFEQVEAILSERKFKPYIKYPKSDKAYYIILSGEKFLERWRNEIGFPSLKNKTKYDLWKKHGFYIPNTPLSKRLESAGWDSNPRKLALQANAVAAVPPAHL